jgi:uncharacterized protein
MEIVNKGKSQGWKNILKIIIPYLVVVAIFQIVRGLIMGLDLKHMQMKGQTSAQLFVTCFMGMVGTLGVVWLFTTKVDKISFMSIGFDRTKIIKDIALGLAIGFFIMFSGFSSLILTHQLQFVDIKFNALNFVYSFGIFVFVAVSEEVFTRGYILRNLVISFNKYVALVVSALIFSLMHLANPNANVVGLSIIFLSGLVLGLPYLYTKNLWFPIALHFSWNFFQGPIFGFNVSGLNFYKLIETKYATANNWNGGEFGFEGSIVAVFFLLGALTAIYFLFKNRKAVEEPEVEELEAYSPIA